jgi:hypothetical protein
MGYADAAIGGDKIWVRTTKTPGVDDFDFMLAASKRVNGGRFFNNAALGGKGWSYPLSIDTCVALRQAFGSRLRVSVELADWYRAALAAAQAQEAVGAAEDVALTRVPKRFAAWLRGYQRVGAKWIANGYRNAGLVADMPGLGKTPETLAAMIEAGVDGPVLLLCPKASVKSVWGYEARRHLRGVPIYLCRGNRAKRERMLKRFSNDVHRDPNKLRIVVVVAEMLRVKLGNPCYTYKTSEDPADKWGSVKIVIGNKISGMCKQRLKSLDGQCQLHVSDPHVIAEAQAGDDDPDEIVEMRAAELAKDKVPVDFEYPILFDRYLFGGWAWVVLDESHKLLGSLTITKGNLMGKGLKLLPYRDGHRRYALSGTPFGKGGKLQGMFGTLHWLWPDEYTSYWKWVKQVFDVEEKVVGYDKHRHAPKIAMNVLGPKGLGPGATPEEESAAWEGFLASLGPRVLRRTKQEMLKDLPPKSYVEVVCEMSPGQRKQFKEMADFAEITTPGGPLIVNGLLALRTRSQQLANGMLTMNKGKAQFTQDSGKLDALWERLDARGIIDGAPGAKLVVASRFNEFLDAIATMLHKDRVDYYRLDGSVSEAKRNDLMEAWQQGVIGPGRGVRVILVNVKAGGVSINLDAADEMHMMDEDPDPGVNEQMEDRIHRASRDHKVVIYYYRTEGTVDYLAAQSVEYRRKLQHAVMDGRRGVEDLREMMIQALEEVE